MEHANFKFGNRSKTPFVGISNMYLNVYQNLPRNSYSNKLISFAFYLQAPRKTPRPQKLSSQSPQDDKIEDVCK